MVHRSSSLEAATPYGPVQGRGWGLTAQYESPKRVATARALHSRTECHRSWVGTWLFQLLKAELHKARRAVGASHDWHETVSTREQRPRRSNCPFVSIQKTHCTMDLSPTSCRMPTADGRAALPLPPSAREDEGLLAMSR